MRSRSWIQSTMMKRDNTDREKDQARSLFLFPISYIFRYYVVLDQIIFFGLGQSYGLLAISKY